MLHHICHMHLRKFSKDHLRTLEIIFEHYGRLVSTNLPVYLRKNIQVTVASSETVTFNEFTNSLSNPVILGIVNFMPLNGNIIKTGNYDLALDIEKFGYNKYINEANVIDKGYHFLRIKKVLS